MVYLFISFFEIFSLCGYISSSRCADCRHRIHLSLLQRHRWEKCNQSLLVGPSAGALKPVFVGILKTCEIKFVCHIICSNYHILFYKVCSCLKLIPSVSCLFGFNKRSEFHYPTCQWSRTTQQSTIELKIKHRVSNSKRGVIFFCIH